MLYTFRFKGKDISVHDSWETFFREQKANLKSIEKNITGVFNPQPEDVFKIFKMSFDDIKYVILGQDPYPQEGVATGRAFEVSGLNSWNDCKTRSLQNIAKSIYYHKHKKNNCDTLPTINEIRNNKNFISPAELFDRLGKNNVFLLNTSLTCETGHSNSHSKKWKCFTKSLLLKLSENEEINWLIWGGEARKAVKHLDINYINNFEKIPHPVINSEDFTKFSGLDKLIFLYEQ